MDQIANADHDGAVEAIKELMDYKLISIRTTPVQCGSSSKIVLEANK